MAKAEIQIATVSKERAADSRVPVLLLDYDRAALAMSMTRAALRDLVYKGRGPVVTKIGARTYFALRDLERWRAARREPTGV